MSMTMIEPQDLTLEQISKLLLNFQEVRDWMESVEQYALDQAIHGNIPPGFVLGSTRTKRIWSNEAEVSQALEGLGIPLDRYMPRSLLSVAQIEKIVGKKEFSNNLLHIVCNTVGNPKLIPSS